MFTPRNYVIIGGNAAGLAAASKIRRLQPTARVRVFEKGPDVSYSNCGIPFLLEGRVAKAGDLIHYSPARLLEQRGLEVFIGHQVLGIDRKKRTVTVRNLETLRDFEVAYDRLLLATGAEPIRPPGYGFESPNVFTLRSLQDGRALHSHVKAHRRAVVVGAGYLGLEIAAALRARGMEVVIVERRRRPLAEWHAAISERVLAELQAAGIQFVAETTIEGLEVEPNGTAVAARVAGDGRVLRGEVFVLAVGVRPAVSLAREAGLALGETGAIAVDPTLRTSDTSVFAAGDCAETRHLLTGKPYWHPFGTTANKQGRVAGENMTGGHRTFPGVLGTSALALFDLEVARTGLTVQQAHSMRLEIESVVVHASDIAGYLPGKKQATVVLHVKRRDGRLLGAEMAGYHGIGARIDVLAAAITAGMTVEGLAQLDLAYAPPIAPVWDPILIAANEAIKRLR